MTILRAALVAALALAPLAAHAQATAPTHLPVTLDLRGAPIRAALEQIFRVANVDFGIDPSVSGFVTLKVTDIPFESALRLILRSSDVPLTYSVEGGVYLVKPRTPTRPADNPASLALPVEEPRRTTTYDRIEFTYADPLDFATILNIQMIPIFTRQGLGVPGATGIIRPGAPGTRNGNGGVVGGGARTGAPTAPGAPTASGGGAIVGF
ncbi:MAG: hypothetical protein H7Y38_16880 [Armatimonadetes bacterium]|nr:hypothetical protein [Armatimonadota bacterium]